jgi:DNA-binding transcriptional regulator GbsR (MarR family)
MNEEQKKIYLQQKEFWYIGNAISTQKKRDEMKVNYKILIKLYEEVSGLRFNGCNCEKGLHKMFNYLNSKYVENGN